MSTARQLTHPKRRVALIAAVAATVAAVGLWAWGGSESATAQTGSSSFSARLAIAEGSDSISFPLATYGFGTVAPSGTGTHPQFVFRFRKDTSTQSADLWAGLIQGTHFDTATLTVLKNGGLYMRVVMTDVLVERLVTQGSGAEQPRDSLVVLTAAKVTARYPSASDGSAGDVGRDYDQPDPIWDLTMVK